MGLLDETRAIERLQFFNGQRLFAADLQGLDDFNREMRWLHNRSLHQPGIGNGYAASGQRGDRQITIGSGYAIDDLGREIILTETRIEPVPPVSGEEDGSSIFFDLTISYPPDENLEEAETRVGLCQTQGVVRRREEPVFSWVRLDKPSFTPRDKAVAQEIKNGRRMIVVRVEVLNCQLNSIVGIAQRRSARPVEQPYTACGVANSTEWKLWPLQQPGSSNLQPNLIETTPETRVTAVASRISPFILSVGLTAVIDTTQAGFVTTPSYSARIQGSRIKSPSSSQSSPVGAVSNQPSLIIDGLININHSSPTSFTVYVLLMVQALTGAVLPRMMSENQAATATTGISPDQEAEFLKLFADWQIVWMGVEG